MYHSTGVEIGIDTVGLRVGDPTDILFLYRHVERILAKDSFGSSDVRLDSTSDDNDHANVERCEFDTEGVAVAVQSRLRCIVW